MDQTNEKPKNKQIRFSIGSYSEKDKRAINKVTRNGLFSSYNYFSLCKSTTTTESFKTTRRQKPEFLDKTDLPKYNTLPNPLRAQYSPIHTQENLLRDNIGNNTGKFSDSVQKPTCPAPINNNCCILVKVNEPLVKKPIGPSKLCDSRSSLPEPDLKHSRKVALIVTAYEGEPKTPTRLEFLPHTRLSRSSSKTSSDASSSIDNVEPISTRLQDELVATLKKSNLKHKNDSVLQETERLGPAENNKCRDETQFVNGNVKKLTAVLDRKLKFIIKSESDEQIIDDKL